MKKLLFVLFLCSAATAASATVIADTTTYSASDPIVEEGRYVAAASQSTFIMPGDRHNRKLLPVVGIKTNLLLFAGVYPDFRHYAVTPNIAVEGFFACRWSVSADFAYSGWTLGDDDTRNRFGYTSFGIEPRIWLSGNGRFNGFYGGVYFAYTQFNVMRPNVREGLGYSGDLYQAGLSVGYVQPLSGRLALEVGLRGGFRHSEFDRYFHQNGNFFFQSSGSKDTFALQAVSISLIYRFGYITNKR